MLEAGVEVRLLMKAANGLEVRMVHVGIHAEQALENGADDIIEVGREGCSKSLGKHPGIINLPPKNAMVSWACAMMAHANSHMC